MAGHTLVVVVVIIIIIIIIIGGGGALIKENQGSAAAPSCNYRYLTPSPEGTHTSSSLRGWAKSPCSACAQSGLAIVPPAPTLPMQRESSLSWW